MAGYIYLVHTPEYMDAGINIYKLGRTSQEDFGRLQDYPKGTKPLVHKAVNDQIRIEAELIAKFNDAFKLVAGREWFEGDRDDMIDMIDEHIRLVRSRSVLVRLPEEKKKPVAKKPEPPRATQPPRAGHAWVKMDQRMEDTIDSIAERFGNVAIDDDDYVRWGPDA